MTKNTAFPWLPQPSTVIGLGVLAGTFCYLITGDPVWAGIAAAAVKMLVPDNSTGGVQLFEAIAKLAQAAGRPLVPTTQSPVAPVSASAGENEERCDERQRLIGGRDHATLRRNREGRASG